MRARETEVMITRFELLCLVRGAWRPAATLLGQVSDLVDSYLSLDDLTCGAFQVGFFIDLDGTPWSDESTVDEPWMTTCWFVAMDALLGGAQAAGPTTGPWEESRLTWRRHSDFVVMEDVHDSGRVAMRRVEVSFDDLARRIAREGEVFAALSRAIHQDIARRRSPEPDNETQRRLDVVAQNWPSDDEFGIKLIERVVRRVEQFSV